MSEERVIQTGSGITLGDVTPQEFMDLVFDVNRSDRDKIDDLEKKLSKDQRKRGKITKKHKEKIEDLIKIVREKQEDIGRLRSKTVESERKAKDLEIQNRDLKIDNSRLKEKIKGLYKDLKIRDQELLRLRQSKVKYIETDTSEYLKKIKDLEFSVENLNQTISDKIHEKMKLTSTISDMKKEIDSYRKSVSRLEAERARMRDQHKGDMNTQKDKIEDLSEQLNAARRGIWPSLKEWLIRHL